MRSNRSVPGQTASECLYFYFEDRSTAQLTASANIPRGIFKEKRSAASDRNNKNNQHKMDLLGSILGSMDKPPSMDKKEKELIEKQKKELEQHRSKERDELNRFRKYAEERLGRLIKDPNRPYMEFQPLDKVHRSVVHDIAEIGGLAALSFGVDGVDRYIVVYKKEHLPSEEELAVRRNGDPWNKQTAEQYIEKRKHQKLLDEERQKKPLDEKKVSAPTTNYKDKYVHLIGQDAALEAAKKTETNKSYGYVPSENKRDIRSIEQTMADIQAKKKLKTQHVSLGSEPGVDNCSTELT